MSDSNPATAVEDGRRRGRLHPQAKAPTPLQPYTTVHPSDQLDQIDAAIVQRLQVDGRASYKAIGESVGVSETTARNRLNRMLDDGLVQVQAVLNTLASASTHIAMANVSVSGDPIPVADELAGWPDSSFVALSAGVYDIIAEFIAVDREGLLDVQRRLLAVDQVQIVHMNVYLRVHKQMYSGPQLR